ncbi:MAG TPA: efflux RND transporter permease subunit [Gemmatimonadaceae bacterium]|nr:efflux RND transporter permease subunit [Gemmatimonadaceae bacterium]
MSLTSASVARPVSTVAATLGIVLLGSVSLSRLPVSLLPDVSLPVLTIRTAYPGAAATEVSRFIAEPIEGAIGATPGLVELRTVSRNNEAVTTARFSWGTDMQSTVLQVRERLDGARSQLPERADRPTLLTSDPGERPIAVLGLTGRRDLRELAHTASDVHARRLEQIDGVASVAVVGAQADEIHVDGDPEKMRALDLTPDDLKAAIEAANANGASGTIRRGQFRFSVRAITEFQSPNEIALVPVGRPGSGVKLRDIATVSVGLAQPKTLTRLDGGPAVGLIVYKDAGSNTVKVTSDLLKAVEGLRHEFPGLHLTVVATQADFVTDALSNLWQEIVLGGVLSLLLILLFLKDFRLSLVIGLFIPLSVLVSLVLLQLLHVTINVLSLGGLALAVGILVDQAIVVAEAVGTQVEKGVPLRDAVVSGTDEIAGPLIAGTITTLLVFGPIIFVRGLAAALFRDLSLSVVTSVGASLILGLTLMPVMMAGRRSAKAEAARAARAARQRERAQGGFIRRIDAFGARLAHYYEAGMAWSLDHAAAVFVIAIVTVGASVWVAARLPREILPQIDEGIVVAQLKLPEGTSIEETTRQTARIEAAAQKLGSKGIYSRVGAATDEEMLAGADPGSAAVSQLIVPVPKGADAAKFADKLRASVPDLAQGALAMDLAGQSEFGSLIGREGRLVRVEVSARTLDDANRWADSVRKSIADLPTLTDVRNAYAATQPIIEVQLERERLVQRGIAPSIVTSALSGGLGGVTTLNDFRETDRRTPITVRYAGMANEDFQTALSTMINGVPVGELIRWKETRAPLEVVRVGQRPVSIIEALIEQGGTAKATKDVSKRLAALNAPAGVAWTLSGADIEQQRTTSELSLVALLSVALMFLVLAGEFASFTMPLVVILTVPAAAAGGIFFLWLTGQSMNAVSLIGIVVMMGLADNEAIVKLAAIEQLRAEGVPLRQAIMEGGHRRLRAIAMTSLTTITGVLPMAFNIGAGGALYQPLAAGVIGGTFSALAVAFFLLPTTYYTIERFKEKRAAARVT